MKNIVSFITRNFLNFILLLDIIIIVILLSISIGVVASSSVEYYFVFLTGTSGKLELLEFIGWVISGLFAVLGVVGLLQGADALDKQNKMTEKGHIQERFKAATEHLGNKESVSARIAAFYGFYRLAKIESEPNSQEHIFDILCAHLRQITKDKNYQSDDKNLVTPGSTEIKPTEEVQSLLKVLFKPDNKDKFIFVGMVADLEGANLQGANLQEVYLLHANLRDANLQRANLQRADMQEANLQEANLQKANLQEANLRDANLRMANLQKVYLLHANLQRANLQRADLQEANLQEANLRMADLQEANLQRADLQEANLQSANLQEVYLLHANLQRADLQGANLQGATINKNNTIMPNGWENVVEKDENGETGVIFV